MDNNKLYFTSVDGRRWPIRPVSIVWQKRVAQQVEDEFRERGEPIDDMYYEMLLKEGGGAKVKFKHDEKSVEQRASKEPGLLDAWNAHQDAKKRLVAEQNNRVGKMWVEDGLKPCVRDIFDTEKAEWLTACEHWGIDVPSGDDEQFDEWIATSIFKTVADSVRFATAMMSVNSSGSVDEEEIDQVVELFRNRTRTERDKARNSTAENTCGDGPVEPQRKIRRSRRSSAVAGATTEQDGAM